MRNELQDLPGLRNDPPIPTTTAQGPPRLRSCTRTCLDCTTSNRTCQDCATTCQDCDKTCHYLLTRLLITQTSYTNGYLCITYSNIYTSYIKTKTNVLQTAQLRNCAIGSLRTGAHHCQTIHYCRATTTAQQLPRPVKISPGPAKTAQLLQDLPRLCNEQENLPGLRNQVLGPTRTVQRLPGPRNDLPRPHNCCQDLPQLSNACQDCATAAKTCASPAKT